MRNLIKTASIAALLAASASAGAWWEQSQGYGPNTPYFYGYAPATPKPEVMDRSGADQITHNPQPAATAEPKSNQPPRINQTSSPLKPAASMGGGNKRVETRRKAIQQQAPRHQPGSYFGNGQDFRETLNARRQAWRNAIDERRAAMYQAMQERRSALRRPMRYFGSPLPLPGFRGMNNPFDAPRKQDKHLQDDPRKQTGRQHSAKPISGQEPMIKAVEARHETMQERQVQLPSAAPEATPLPVAAAVSPIETAPQAADKPEAPAKDALQQAPAKPADPVEPAPQPAGKPEAPAKDALQQAPAKPADPVEPAPQVAGNPEAPAKDTLQQASAKPAVPTPQLIFMEKIPAEGIILEGILMPPAPVEMAPQPILMHDIPPEGIILKGILMPEAPASAVPQAISNPEKRSKGVNLQGAIVPEIPAAVLLKNTGKAVSPNNP